MLKRALTLKLNRLALLLGLLSACHKERSKAQPLEGGASAQGVAVKSVAVKSDAVKSEAVKSTSEQEPSSDQRLRGALSHEQIERLVEALSEIKPERERVLSLKGRLGEVSLSASQLAILLEAFDLNVARFEVIELLAPRLVEGEREEEERHALLDLFEDAAARARAVDLLGWH